jgi:thiamine pyrophosphokinase
VETATAGLAIVLADGDAPDRAALDATWPGWDDDLRFVAAADGGARHAAGLGLRIDRWVGDGDSIAAEDLADLREAGVRVDVVPAAKDETDTELALRAAIESGAARVTLLGGTGGARLDHALANIGLLAHPLIGNRTVTLLDARTRVRLLRGKASMALDGRRGDLVSLLPFRGDAEGVRTVGLEYPLRGEPLPFGPARGISNVRVSETASVSLERGAILVVETPVTLSP